MKFLRVRVPVWEDFILLFFFSIFLVVFSKSHGLLGNTLLSITDLQCRPNIGAHSIFLRITQGNKVSLTTANELELLNQALPADLHHELFGNNAEKLIWKGALGKFLSRFTETFNQSKEEHCSQAKTRPSIRSSNIGLL